MKKIIYFTLLALVFAACNGNKDKIEITVSNPLTMDRTDEMVEISYNTIVEQLGLSAHEQFVIFDDASNEVPYQAAFNSNSVTDTLLIFPVSLTANSSAVYTIKKGTPTRFDLKVYGRLVSERKDDFTWENDKIAFRVYGPALEATGEISSGIDVWAKRTEQLIIDKWYSDELAGISSYHTDNGEGLDFYKVGPTLGAGGTAPYIKDSLWYSKNFTTYEVLDNGPLRLTVKLNYATYIADGKEITPTRIISLDKGSQLNKIRVKYVTAEAELRVATGLITRRANDEANQIDVNKYFATYKEPTDSLNGTLYTAFIATTPFESIAPNNRHILGVQAINSGDFYVYYAGGGWSKNGFETYESWNQYVSDFAEKVKNPLNVEIK